MATVVPATKPNDPLTVPTMDYITADELASDPLAASLFNTARLWVASHGKTVDAGSILTFCTTLMSMVQRLVKEKHSGTYKKRLVLTILRLSIDEVDFESPEAKAMVVTVLETTVVDFVDKAVQLATGQITIHKIMQGYSPCCFPTASAGAKAKAHRHATRKKKK